MAQFKFKITLDCGFSFIHTIKASNKLDAFAKIKDFIKSRYTSPDFIKYELTNNKENNMNMSKDENIINFDFQGWPEYKRSIKDMIIAFGGVYNEENKKWEIPDSELLDSYPRILEDDGMGYGVNERYIIDVDVDKVTNICNIWHDAQMEYVQVYIELGINPGYIFKTEDGTEYVIVNVNVNRETYKVSFECFKWDFQTIKDATKHKQHEKYIPERKMFDAEYIAECIKREKDKCDLKTTTENI